jgi:tripartite-type tricarboxylate transporter receptor subunit TctC
MFKNLKAAVFAASFMVAQVAMAEKIIVANPYPPGGSVDQIMQVIKSAAQRQGTEIEIQYHKSCAEAIDAVRRSDKNTFLNIVSDVYDPKNPDAKCALDSDKDGLQVWGSPASSPYYFCSAPGKKLSFDEMSAQPRKAGMVAAPDLMAYLGHVISNTKKPNQIQVVPYRGGGEIVKAGQAGDIDMWFGASQIRAFPADQITCYGSSVRNDPRGVEFVGNLTKKGVSVPEYALVSILLTDPKTLSAPAAKAMAAAINSAELREYMDKNKMAAGTLDGQLLHNNLVKLNQSIKTMQTK